MAKLIQNSLPQDLIFNGVVIPAATEAHDEAGRLVTTRGSVLMDDASGLVWDGNGDAALDVVTGAQQAFEDLADDATEDERELALVALEDAQDRHFVLCAVRDGAITVEDVI